MYKSVDFSRILSADGTGCASVRDWRYSTASGVSEIQKPFLAVPVNTDVTVRVAPFLVLPLVRHDVNLNRFESRSRSGHVSR